MTLSVREREALYIRLALASILDAEPLPGADSQTTLALQNIRRFMEYQASEAEIGKQVGAVLNSTTERLRSWPDIGTGIADRMLRTRLNRMAAWLKEMESFGASWRR